MEDSIPSLTQPDALVAVMIAISASHGRAEVSELVAINQIVNHLPVFADYDLDRIPRVANIVYDLFREEEGLDALLALIRVAVAEHMYETAYALACDVAAADGHLYQSELRLLEEIREELRLDRLHAAAIERGARARHMAG
ncbi:tellurite resistance TerB family protein [Falsirhodobacter halotolerans]|nr:tellurite resistance TerB family protein [Falsirhodobacter halotolerans]